MKFEVQIGQGGKAQNRSVELEGNHGRGRVAIDGRTLEAEVLRLTPNSFSILLGGRSYELCVTRQPDGSLKVQQGASEFVARVVDPRAWRGRSGVIEAEGRQNVLAPMPGKVVRLLVRTGDQVEAGQGLVVVEAMKMQNELRSPKRGTVQRLAVAEGEAVNAGQVLLSID
jgi:biotin carboxyl carrier protein